MEDWGSSAVVDFMQDENDLEPDTFTLVSSNTQRRCYVFHCPTGKAGELPREDPFDPHTAPTHLVFSSGRYCFGLVDFRVQVRPSVVQKHVSAWLRVVASDIAIMGLSVPFRFLKFGYTHAVVKDHKLLPDYSRLNFDKLRKAQTSGSKATQELAIALARCLGDGRATVDDMLREMPSLVPHRDAMARVLKLFQVSSAAADDGQAQGIPLPNLDFGCQGIWLQTFPGSGKTIFWKSIISKFTCQFGAKFAVFRANNRGGFWENISSKTKLLVIDEFALQESGITLTELLNLMNGEVTVDQKYLSGGVLLRLRLVVVLSNMTLEGFFGSNKKYFSDLMPLHSKNCTDSGSFKRRFVEFKCGSFSKRLVAREEPPLPYRVFQRYLAVPLTKLVGDSLLLRTDPQRDKLQEFLTAPEEDAVGETLQMFGFYGTRNGLMGSFEESDDSNSNPSRLRDRIADQKLAVGRVLEQERSSFIRGIYEGEVPRNVAKVTVGWTNVHDNVQLDSLHRPSIAALANFSRGTFNAHDEVTYRGLDDDEYDRKCRTLVLEEWRDYETDIQEKLTLREEERKLKSTPAASASISVSVNSGKRRNQVFDSPAPKTSRKRSDSSRNVDSPYIFEGPGLPPGQTQEVFAESPGDPVGTEDKPIPKFWDVAALLRESPSCGRSMSFLC